MPEESALVLAARHVVEGRLIVANQRQRIAELKAAGISTLDAEENLRILERSLDIFEAYERQLRQDGA